VEEKSDFRFEFVYAWISWVVWFSFIHVCPQIVTVAIAPVQWSLPARANFLSAALLHGLTQAAEK
jgi:hypothetical protein